jgi:hypothetical protein
VKGQNELIVAVAIIFLAIALGIAVQLWNPAGNQATGYAGQTPVIVNKTPVHDGTIHRYRREFHPGDNTYNIYETLPYLTIYNLYYAYNSYDANQAYIKFNLSGETGFQEAYLNLTKVSTKTPSSCPSLYKIADYGTLDTEDFDAVGTLIQEIPCNDTSVRINVSQFVVPNTVNAFMIKSKNMAFVPYPGYSIQERINYGSMESANPPVLELQYFSAPVIPANLTASIGANPGQINLTWDASTDAGYYKIKWAAGTSNGITENVTSTNYVHSTSAPSPPGLLHQYQISACNDHDVCSDFSAITGQASAYPQISANANSPNGITGQSITLNGSGTYLTSPTYSWSITGTANCLPANPTGQNPSVICSNVGTANATLTINDSGGRTATSNTTITVVQSPPSNPPQNFIAGLGSNSGQVNLSWNSVSDATRYEIDWAVTGTSYAGTINISSGSTTTTIHSTPQAETQTMAMHNYKIKACNSGGCSLYSNTVSSYPKIGTANAGTQYSATGNLAAGVEVNLSGTGTYLAPNPSFLWSLTENNAQCSLSSTTIQNPVAICYAAGTSKVTLRITAANGITVSNPATIIISEAPPTVPQGLTAVKGNNEGEINVSWSAVTNAHHYVLRWNSGAGSQEITGISYTHTTTEINNLGQQYTYEIKACDNKTPPLCSAYSSIVSAYPKIGARANDPYQTIKATPIQLNGSAVFEVGTVSYSWTITNSVGTPNCTPTSSTTQNPTITCANIGTANVSLTVSTALNGTSIPKTTTIEVANTPDTTPPTITLIQPNPNTTLTGTVTLTATASDNVAVRSVEFFRGTNSIVVIESSPYTYSWNTVGTPNGNYTLKAKATDTSGNTAETLPINITIFNEAVVCSQGQERNCTTTENCAGTQTCSNNAWGSCVDAPNDNCPVITECTNGQTQNCITTENCAGTKTCSNNVWGLCIDKTGDNCPTECITGNTQDCTTTENCAGTKTCSASVWSACQDKPGDNCPAQAQCSAVSDCYSSYPKERCDLTARKHYSRTVNCVSGLCTAGSWIDSGEYCTKCIHCGDGELNCSETCTSCPTETGCQDTEAPEKPNGLTVYEKTETSITIRWNPNEEEDLKRYVIYFGTSSGNYTSQKIALAYEVELTITGLQKATNYFITLKALDLSENSSPYSNEVTALTNGTIEPDCSENKECNELCDNDPDCTTKKCIEDETCDKNCTADPDCKALPQDNIMQWGIGTAIIAVSAALAYVFFTVEG